jgi:hypothetical protein
MRALTGFRLDILCLLAFILFALVFPVHALTSNSFLEEQAILLPPSTWGNPSRAFGFSVDIDGDYAIVGDPGYRVQKDFIDLEYAGTAHIYFQESGVWQHQTQFTAPDPVSDDWMGYSVAVSGDTVAVSIPYEDLSEDDNRGAVLLYERSGVIWSKVATLTTSDGVTNDKIGISISLDGDILVVGAPYADIGGVHNQGAAYIFVKPDTGWNDMTETARITASDGAEDDWFGNSVAVYGEWLVVGAPQVSSNGMISAGAAYVFNKPAAGWTTSTETVKLTAPVPAFMEKFGSAVAIRDNRLGVGCDNQDIHMVTVYRLDTGNWIFDARIAPPEGVPDAAFGRSLAVGNDQILVGSIAYDNSNPDSGHAHLYLRDDSGWVYDSTLIPSDGTPFDFFGWSTATDGTSFIVGADVAGIFNSGQAYIFAHEALLPDASVSVVPTTLELWEGGSTESYSVSLSTQPTGDVTITVEHDSQVSLSPTTLVFTALNWDIPQNVSVQAVRDVLSEGDHSSEIQHASTSEDERYQDLIIPSINISIHESQYSLFLPLSIH